MDADYAGREIQIDVFAAYKSPVELMVDQVMDRLDQEIENAVNLSINYEIKVNKEEMIKALQYDRDQYRIGYEQGKKDAIRHGHWRKSGNIYICDGETGCGFAMSEEQWYQAHFACPACGAKMDEEAKK